MQEVYTVTWISRGNSKLFFPSREAAAKYALMLFTTYFGQSKRPVPPETKRQLGEFIEGKEPGGSSFLRDNEWLINGSTHTLSDDPRMYKVQDIFVCARIARLERFE